MPMIGEFCGRPFVHESHEWEKATFGVDPDNWETRLCAGITEGPTEQEFIRGTHGRLVETGPWSLREKLERFINDPANHTKHPNIEPSVSVADIKRILEDDK